MPGLKLNGRKGWLSLLVGIALAVVVVLLAYSHEQVQVIEDHSLQQWSTNARNTDSATLVEKIKAVPRLHRRGDDQTEARPATARKPPSRSGTGQPVLGKEQTGSGSATLRMPEASGGRGAEKSIDDLSDSDADGSRSARSTNEESSAGSESPDDATWAAQRNDGLQGQDPEAIDMDWEICSERGQDIQELLGVQSLPSGQRSKFWDYKEIENFGWSREVQVNNDISPHVTASLQALGVNVWSGKWTTVTLRHVAESTPVPGGRNYKPTRAFYELIFNPKLGIIIVIDVLGPAHTDLGKAIVASEGIEGIVPLKHLSDFVFLEWQHLCEQENVRLTDIRYIVQKDVANEQTRNVVRKAVGGFLRTNLGSWPGKSFETPDQLRAMIGTPNGIAVGRMLVQRSAALGADRKVTNVRAWIVRPHKAGILRTEGPILFMLFDLKRPSGHGSGLHDKRPGGPIDDPRAGKQPAIQ